MMCTIAQVNRVSTLLLLLLLSGSNLPTACAAGILGCCDMRVAGAVWHAATGSGSSQCSEACSAGNCGTGKLSTSLNRSTTAYLLDFYTLSTAVLFAFPTVVFKSAA